MRFVAVPGRTVQFSVYETRVKDFRTFVRETGYVHMRETADPNSRMWSLDRDGYKQRGHSWENPGLAQTDEHPVVGVKWYEAKAFCEWLTLRERAAGRLPANREYRLPRDHEWSVAVGLVEEDPAKTPEEKDEKIEDRYPWGEWPEGQAPPEGAGNYAGAEADDGHWPANLTTLAGYRDGYARTAPVGSFPPNGLGIHDLGGNVWEWCEDLCKGEGYKNRVVRGASWRNFGRDYLLSSFRLLGHPLLRYDYGGFRCVVGASSP
jgi:formylglycine-generating enzyme required for sulfatase activity